MAAVLGGLVNWAGTFGTLAAPSGAGTNQIRIVGIQGEVEVFRGNAQRGVRTTETNQVLDTFDRLRTGPDSRVLLRWSDQSVVHFGALTEIEILPPQGRESSGLRLLKGLLSFFHRDEPGRIRLITRGALAGVKGTEFVVKVEMVNGTERTTFSVVDGEVEFGNDHGTLRLTNGQEAFANPGESPQLSTAGFIVNNVLQWCFYYPAVLDLRDLPLTTEERNRLSESLAAYRAGDLLVALAAYPAAHQAVSEAGRIYRAALLLAVGQVQQTEEALTLAPAAGPTEHVPRLAAALRQLIAAVKRQPNPSTLNPQLSTEFLAASYYEQSRATGDESLKTALHLAWQAATNSPEFGFAWARVAELEFSFGRTDRALDALNKSLALSPRNAQALALHGFLLAAQNKIGKANEKFNEAISVDSGLGNAWLGRGLCRIRQGDARGGREDLLLAAALEPQRALLRSYLGKAFADAGKATFGERELQLALGLDPQDPTGWLYSALLKQQQNRINEAIGDLEKSSDLNDNRALFRSRLLLDQDRAVRSANLASVYRDAGMTEVSRREAARAVTYDYANDSAHLFLSDSFNELRDPTRFNLRYETVWFNELLLANLLAPVGAGRLAQNVTQQEYSKLFESDGAGMASHTSYRSDGQVRELGSLFGTHGNTSWALDFDYQHNDGVRPNNQLDRLEWYTTVKQQLTPSDTLLLLVKYQDYSSGDNFQYYDPSASYRPNFKFEEQQEPILIGGYQHEWAPGVRTLVLGGRLVNDQKFSDRQTPQMLLAENPSGVVDTPPGFVPFDVKLDDDLEIYTAEVSQIFQRERFSVISGLLWQGGDFDYSGSLSNSPLPESFLPPISAVFSEPFERFKAYGYLTIKPVEKLWLTGGVSYDSVKMPANFRSLPQNGGTEDRDLVSPKAAFLWSPLPEATLRGIYSRSLGGVSLDESYRLEPTQLAGFAQSFRTVISESVVGSVSAPEYEVLGLALDLKLGRRTYAGVQWERTESDVERTIGVFRLEDGLAPFVPSTTREQLDYEEHSLALNLNQLLGSRFVAGVSYRVMQAKLDTTLPEIPAAVFASADRREEAWLHQMGGYLLYNDPLGWFARFDARYYQQSNHGYTPDQPGDAFVQLDFQAGWRFARRQAELSVGVLNLADQDYRLNPLTVYAELPRERVFIARFSFRF